MKYKLNKRTLINLLKKWDFWAVCIIFLVCILCASLGVPKSFGPDGWIVLGVIALLFVVLIKDYIPTDFAMLLALAVLMFSQTVSTSEALAGFASSAVLSVAVLYVVAGGLTATGALDYLMNLLLGTPTTIVSAQFRLMLPTSIISAFINNTPLVAIMIPITQQWASKVGIPLSKLMIPLSFAAVLGGTCTLIGTSTNLVVAGKAKEDLSYNIGLFDLGTVGVPTLCTGMLYILIFSKWLLPGADEVARRQKKDLFGSDSEKKILNRADNSSSENVLSYQQQNNFTVSCLVNTQSPIVNKSVQNLRGLSGLYLTSVQRKDELLQAVGPEFVICANDILYFTGVVDSFPQFCAQYDFTPITTDNEDSLLSFWRNASSTQVQPRKRANSNDSKFKDSGPHFMTKFESSPAISAGDLEDAEIITGEVVPTTRIRRGTFESHVHRVIVTSNGQLVGKTPKQVVFRRTYKAAILSIYRRGSKVHCNGALGDFVLQGADELMILTAEDFDWDAPATKRDLTMVVESGHLESNQHILDREYLISMRVSGESQLLGTKSLVGLSIEAAGLRGLPGLFLIALERNENDKQIIKHAVGREEILSKGDILWFVGERDALPTLRRIPGLMSPNNDQVTKLKFKKVERRLVECVISMSSEMIGQTIRETRFRTKYRAAVIGVHRQGHRVIKKIGDIILEAGDVLILETGPYFMQRFRDDPNFLLVAEIENSETPQFGKFYIALFAIIGMMALYTFFQQYEEHSDITVSLFECAVLASAVMIYFNIITPVRARKAINWDVIISIACAFGLSTALENSGVAVAIGDGLVRLANSSGTGQTGILAAVYLATFLLSIVIANNAAALLMFPIALRAVNQENSGELQQMFFILMLAASSSFSSPFGYQTNLMVYGPGNYIFTDFLRFGLPMQLWQMVASVTFVALIDYWYICWIVSIAALVLFVMLTNFGGKCAKVDKPLSGEASNTTGAGSKEEVVIG